MMQKLVSLSQVNSNLTPHSFRRMFATLHCRNDVAIEKI